MQSSQQFQPYAAGPTPGSGIAPFKPPKTYRPWFLIIALAIASVLLLGFIGFGVWAFTSRQDYKNNSDQKSAKAVAIAVQNESSKKDNEFVEKEKNPLKTYVGPEAYGSVSISYPKTWGAYVVQTDRASVPVDGYFHPNFVPGLQSGTAYALRVQIMSQSYDQEMKQFDSKVKSGKVSVAPFVAKSVPGVTGARVEGEINTGQKDYMILLPLRDKTLKISTESQQFVGDFDNIILANLKFVP